jgi:hypothetical protein
LAIGIRVVDLPAITPDARRTGANAAGTGRTGEICPLEVVPAEPEK